MPTKRKPKARKPAKRKKLAKRHTFKSGAAKKVRAEYNAAKATYHRLGKRLMELHK